MKRLITLGVGAAIGYLLGSREGRQNLDKFAKNAQKLWNDPKTQQQVHKATSAVKDKAPAVADKATELADKAADSLKDKSPGMAEKASNLAHDAAGKATTATQNLADKASSAARESTSGKHSSDSSGTTGTTGPGSSYDTEYKNSDKPAKASNGDAVSDPSQSLESEGGGPDRY